MAEDNNLGHNYQNSASPSLLSELQYLLHEMAVVAESHGQEYLLGKSNELLRLIGSYQMAAQLELGQLRLDFEPCSLGSVMHDVAYELFAAHERQVGIQSAVMAPAMTEVSVLKNLLFHAGSSLVNFTDKPLQLISFSTKSGEVGVGVFAKDLTMQNNELREGLANQNARHMPLAGYSDRSVIQLSLAETLAKALNGRLIVKKHQNLRGFAAILPRSEQLSFVTA